MFKLLIKSWIAFLTKRLKAIVKLFLIWLVLIYLHHLYSTNNTESLISEISRLEMKLQRDGCLSIDATSLLADVNINENIGGKFMKTSDILRDLANFLHLPRGPESVNDDCIHIKDNTRWKIGFFIKSSATNFDRRMVIRETWGSIKIYKFAFIKIIFLVGTVDEKAVKEKLLDEIKFYQDILQIDLVESSKIVPEKILAGMQWSSEYLSHDWIYASGDDDMVVYLPNLLEYLNGLLQPVKHIPRKLAKLVLPCYKDLPIICVHSYQPTDQPERKSVGPDSKWFISKEDYPNEYWPPYCRGGLYLMSNKLTSEIFSISRQTPRLYLDDVWITGFMRRKLNKGDCNILAAPHSTNVTLSLDNIPDSEVLVRHLMGDIEDIIVDVVSEMRNEWNRWKKSINFMPSRC